MTNQGIYQAARDSKRLVEDSLFTAADSVILAYLHAAGPPATGYQRKEVAKLTMRRAYLAYVRGDTSEARDIYRIGQALFSYMPDSLHVRALVYLGWTYYAQGDYSAALALWNEAEAMALSRNVLLLPWIGRVKAQLGGKPVTATPFDREPASHAGTYVAVLSVGLLVLILLGAGWTVATI